MIQVWTINGNLVANREEKVRSFLYLQLLGKGEEVIAIGNREGDVKFLSLFDLSLIGIYGLEDMVPFPCAQHLDGNNPSMNQQKQQQQEYETNLGNNKNQNQNKKEAQRQKEEEKEKETETEKRKFRNINYNNNIACIDIGPSPECPTFIVMGTTEGDLYLIGLPLLHYWKEVEAICFQQQYSYNYNFPSIVSNAMGGRVNQLLNNAAQYKEIGSKFVNQVVGDLTGEVKNARKEFAKWFGGWGKK